VGLRPPVAKPSVQAHDAQSRASQRSKAGDHASQGWQICSIMAGVPLAVLEAARMRAFGRADGVVLGPAQRAWRPGGKAMPRAAETAKAIALVERLSA